MVREIEKLTEKDEKRFFKYVDKTDGCWFWKGSLKSNRGRGRFRIGYVVYIPQRVSFFIHNGYIISEKFVLQTCGNPSCVNPDHLYQEKAND